MRKRKRLLPLLLSTALLLGSAAAPGWAEADSAAGPEEVQQLEPVIAPPADETGAGEEEVPSLPVNEEEESGQEDPEETPALEEIEESGAEDESEPALQAASQDIDWTFLPLGSGATASSNTLSFTEAGEAVLKATNGKLAGNEEGIGFYYKELSANANFELKTTMKVVGFNGASLSNPQQISLGAMVRDSLHNTNKDAPASKYVALGALAEKSGTPAAVIPFYRNEASNKKILDAYTGFVQVKAGDTFELSIVKSGNAYKLTADGQSYTMELPSLFGEHLYAGVYVARDAEVAFGNLELIVHGDETVSLNTEASDMKTDYLVGEKLDTAGLKVTAQKTGGSVVELSADDYFITGFDSASAGEKTLTVHYAGQSATIPYKVENVTILELLLKYEPAKTAYYLGDMFDPAGLVVEATYNNGLTSQLTADQYELVLPNDLIEPGTEKFTQAGKGIVTILPAGANGDSPSASFEISVSDAELTAIEVTKEPEKLEYYLNEEPDFDGMVVYAKYGSEIKVRLEKVEYDLSDLDTSTAGTKTVTVTHKNKQTTFEVKVIAKAFDKLILSQYPKTTFDLGEVFSDEGIEVSRLYNNGDTVKLDASGYSLDSTAFNSAHEGVYTISVSAIEEPQASLDYEVTVRAKQTYEWKGIRFGQSTAGRNDSNGLNNNRVVQLEDGSVQIIAEGGSAGKVTGDHDGLSYYYTTLSTDDNFELTADIKVNAYAKQPSYDGQESFGIMARDVTGTDGDASVFGANIAAVGGFSGGSRNPNGTQLFVRNGVEDTTGAGSTGVKSIMLSDVTPGPGNTPYKLTLSKTNSGFTAKIGDGKEEIFYTPDILKVQDKEHMQVGFYSARLADIIVSNISLTVTDAATDAPKVEAPPTVLTPAFDVVSPLATGEGTYSLKFRANADGVVMIKHGRDIIEDELEVKAGVVSEVSVDLNPGDNAFSLIFLPDDTQVLSSFDKIITNATVTYKTYEGDKIIVSPSGTPAGDGTPASPLDIDTAIAYVVPGQTIELQDGRYVRSKPLEVKKYNDGREGALKNLFAAEGATPILDFDQKSEGVIFSGNYWHVKGIHVTNSQDNYKGFTLGGSYNLIEQSEFYRNGDTGMQISRTDTSATREEWPSHNLILNSTSYENRDSSENNADGFAAKLTVGDGNVFDGCIAYSNADDGWDLYTKAGTGAIGVVTIRNSIAYNHGIYTDGTISKGDGNGFKLGGEGIEVKHVIENSLAFNNYAYGFTSNSNPGIIVKNSVSVNNHLGNLNLATYTGIAGKFELGRFVSYSNAEGMKKDYYPSNLTTDRHTYLFDGKDSRNSATGITLTDSHFSNLDYDHTTVIPRKGDGTINWDETVKFLGTTTPNPNPNPDPTGPVYPSPTAPATPAVPATPEETGENGSGEEGSGTPAPSAPLVSASGVTLSAEPEAYIKGYTDGSFKPNQAMSREEAIAMLFNLVVNEGKEDAPAAAAIPSDIAPDRWSAKAVAYFRSNGLAGGYPDGSFRPEQAITRAELLAILVKFLPAGEMAAGQTGFADVSGHWAEAVIAAAHKAGWINGYGDGTFRPDKPVTRAEAVTIVNRMLGRTPGVPSGDLFGDVPAGHWASGQIEAASRP